MAPVNPDKDAMPELLEPVRQGLTSVMICSTISLFATSTLLSLLAYKAIKEYRASRKPGYLSSALRGTYSIHTQGYFWLVNLFIADFVQCLGLVIVGKALVQDSVHYSPSCTLQGFLINCGDIGSAIWSFVIAFHTFFLLAGGRRWRTWVAEKSTSGKGRWFMCLGIWVFILFIGLIGPLVIEPVTGKGPFYNQAGAGWCWIEADYYYERIFFHYIFLFIDMFALTILYCILFFYIRIQLKNFTRAASTSENVQSSHELRTWQANLEAGQPDQPTAPKQIITTQTVTVTTEDRPQRRQLKTEADRAHKRMNHVALTLLCYPVMYICLTMPLSIARISQFAGDNPTWASVYAGASIYCLSGLVNVLLYTATRKGIISWNWLFKKRGTTNTTTDHPPPPPYNPHYPGSHHGRRNSDSTLHLPSTTVVSAKPSATSIGRPPPMPLSPGSGKSVVDVRDSDSDLEFEFSSDGHFGRVKKGSTSS